MRYLIIFLTLFLPLISFLSFQPFPEIRLIQIPGIAVDGDYFCYTTPLHSQIFSHLIIHFFISLNAFDCVGVAVHASMLCVSSFHCFAISALYQFFSL